GATGNASGTVDYRYYTDQLACAADAAAWPATPTSGTDVGTVTVTNGSVPNSAAVQFNNANTYYWAAFYTGDNNNNPAASNCSSEVLLVSPVTGQITPTNTTCQQFIGGTASSLTTVDYQTRGTATIQNAQPGVFFYYVMVTAPSAKFTVNVTQTILN